MNTQSKMRFLSASVAVCILIIAVLSYNTWNLSKEVETIKAAQPAATLDSASTSPLAEPWPDSFDPWSGNWDPTGQFEAARKRMDTLMGSMLPGNSIFSNQGFGLSPASPRVLMKETEDEYLVVVDVHGGQNVELDTQLKSGVLTISGVVNSSSNDEGTNAYAMSHSSARFSQSMTLPEAIDEAAMTVDQSDDEIVIVIPKSKDE